MRDILIREFNDKFLEEINNMYVVKNFAGYMTEKELNELHRIIGEAILKTLYEQFPTIIHFYPFFMIFSNNKRLVERKRFSASHKTRFQNYSERNPEKAEEMLARGKKKRALREALFRRFSV